MDANQGHPSEISDVEIELIDEKLREELKKMCQIEGIWPLPQDVHNDRPGEMVLDRYLVVRHKRVKKALNGLKSTLEWRRKNEIGAILQRPLSEKSNLAIRQLTSPHYHCFDRKGRPVFIERLGLLHLPTLKKYGATADDYLQHHIQLLEYFQSSILEKASKSCGHALSMHTVILDLEGAELSQTTSEHLRLFRKITDVDQNHYPEIAATIFVLNAPKVFRVIWHMGRPFIEKRVRDRIFVIAPENQEEVMSKFIDAKYLPVRYGGKDSSCGLCTGDAASLKNQDGQPSQAALDIKPEGRAKKVLSSAFYKEMDEHMAQLQAEHEKKTTAESSTSLASYIGNGKMSSSRPHGWSWRKKERE